MTESDAGRCPSVTSSLGTTASGLKRKLVSQLRSKARGGVAIGGKEAAVHIPVQCSSVGVMEQLVGVGSTSVMGGGGQGVKEGKVPGPMGPTFTVPILVDEPLVVAPPAETITIDDRDSDVESDCQVESGEVRDEQAELVSVDMPELQTAVEVGGQSESADRWFEPTEVMGLKCGMTPWKPAVFKATALDIRGGVDIGIREAMDISSPYAALAVVIREFVSSQERPYYYKTLHSAVHRAVVGINPTVLESLLYGFVVASRIGANFLLTARRQLKADDNFITPLRLFVSRGKLTEFLQHPGVVPAGACFRQPDNLVISEFEALATCLASHKEILRPEDAFLLARSHLKRPHEETLMAAIHVVMTALQFVAEQTASVGEADSTTIVVDNLTGWVAVECDDLQRWGSWPSGTVRTSGVRRPCARGPGACPGKMKGGVIGPKNKK